MWIQDKKDVNSDNAACCSIFCHPIHIIHEHINEDAFRLAEQYIEKKRNENKTKQRYHCKLIFTVWKQFNTLKKFKN